MMEPVRESDAGSTVSDTSTPPIDDEDKCSTTCGSDRNDSGSTDGISHEKQQVQKFAQNESKHVRVWRRNVVIVLVVMCALVTTLTYNFLAQDDTEDFETSFRLFSQTIAENIEFNTRSLMDAANGVSSMLSFEAAERNMTWPFVTLPVFDIYVQHTSARANTEFFAVIPLVWPDQVQDWNAYSNANQNWIRNGLAMRASQEHKAQNPEDSDYAVDPADIEIDPITPGIFHRVNFTQVVFDDGTEDTCCGPDFPSMPLWQLYPTPKSPRIINDNQGSYAARQERYNSLFERRAHFITEADPNPLAGLIYSFPEHVQLHHIPGVENMSPEQVNGLMFQMPHSFLTLPVFEEFENKKSPIVAVTTALINWDSFIRDILPSDANEFYAVLQNSCGQSFTFLIDGPEVIVLGAGKLNDARYEGYKYNIPMYKYFDQVLDYPVAAGCVYWYDIYPAHSFYEVYQTRTPIFFAIIVASSFLLMAFTFFIYDFMVVRKNDKIMDAAAQSSAIVSSMFPSAVRDRLFANRDSSDNDGSTSFKEETGKSRLSSFLNTNLGKIAESDDKEGKNEFLMSKPIADLFPETTVMFADLVGFTAWSSMREPSQVFVLLETIYSAFDKIAKRRRIFKVETVGDCYVAVTGLPEPRKDHAVAMARFANECLLKLRELTHQLEVVLGPDTGDLSMRVGLHSGPVTAGVLRGERSRFQLFGDTMNTASRMESTGKPNCIQVSQETADQILASGKKSWLEKRQDVVLAKGKGIVNTFWLSLNVFTPTDTTSVSDDPKVNSIKVRRTSFKKSASSPVIIDHHIEDKTSRLVQWNVDVLSRLLKQIVARRKSRGKPSEAKSLTFEYHVNAARKNTTPLEEVTDIITLPEFDSKDTRLFVKIEDVVLDTLVERELQDYVTSIAMMYRTNPFHNFEHASHVTMSVVKLLSRIVAPIDFQIEKQKATSESAMRTRYESTLHDHTYGITSDPLTQFSCVLSALVHDADHTGVTNAQLIKEKQSICRLYKDRSVAEQNSVDLAWELLMDASYCHLRTVIYTDESEMRRFRQLLVNSVMATDIMDKDLGAQRKARWNDAFANESNRTLSRQQSINQKATIVIEHLIQASDVAHTMQHWHIYRKWNERLYKELYKAYIEGRAEKDPSDFWYNGEIGFFDFYIIPLAKKLKNCGVFGVSSDEYLQYAEKNRKEWEIKGEQVVAEMSEKVKIEYGH